MTGGAQDSGVLLLHRLSIVAVLPFMIAVAIIFGAIIGPIEAVGQVLTGFRQGWGEKS
ncbi:hypothetical protein [Sphingomonas sp. LH128]|uniref:hypothetical protein n=1 Tax=Sphingomonas sp. LH128 TaxID=473781 RepID=UPI0002DBAE9F|nr:hypothetical protein [Sphingomonas sp. LH128]